MSDNLNIHLTKSEALVLFEFLVRINQESDEDVNADEAEQRVLWDLEASLEQQLPELFDPRYNEIIMEARNQVRNKG